MNDNRKLHWFTLPQDAGQIVSVEYAYDREGGAYRRVKDGPRVVYHHGVLDEDHMSETTTYDVEPIVECWRASATPL